MSCGVGLLLHADGLGEQAAPGEDAARQLLADVRHEARDRVEPAVILPDTAARDAAHQPDGVRVPRVLQHRLRVALLDELAGVEDADAVAHLADDPEVVADEEHGRVQLRLEPGDEVEHLRLDGRVEARRRLVEDQERGLGRERHRDHDALLHAAGELVREPGHDGAGVGDLHPLERMAGEVVGCARLLAPDPEHLGDLLADPDRRDSAPRRGSGRPSRRDSERSFRSCDSLSESASRPSMRRPPERTRPLRGR